MRQTLIHLDEIVIYDDDVYLKLAYETPMEHSSISHKGKGRLDNKQSQGAMAPRWVQDNILSHCHVLFPFMSLTRPRKN